jgi:cell division protein FtsI/penicillin-binding protein 2
LPAEKPQISIIVVVDESAGTPLSGDVAAPIFQRIAEGTIHYLNRQNLFAQRISERRLF